MTLKLKRDAVLLEGGPRDGWAYYHDDLLAIVKAIEYFGHSFDYRPTDRRKVHPRAGGRITSEVWEYCGPTRGATADSVPQDDPWAESYAPCDDPWAQT